MKEIPVILTDRSIYPLFKPNALTRKSSMVNNKRSRSRSNLINIKLAPSANTKSQLPNFLSTNVRSLLPKVDELILLLQHTVVDLIAISETWLHDGIDDNFLQIPKYNFFRRDRLCGRGGGVCAYVSETIPSKRRDDLENCNYECMWVWIRPFRLPRSITGIIIGIVYSPPDKTIQEQRDLVAYLVETLDLVRNTYPECGIVLLGDFNNLDISDLLGCHDLSQVVTTPTRGSAILDLVITNIHSFYDIPSITAPLGTSDHKIVQWCPRISAHVNIPTTARKRHYRCFPQSAREAFGRWVTHQDWHVDGQNLTIEELVSAFTSNISAAMDKFFPKKIIKLHPSDKPWMTASLKNLIMLRQRAFHSGNINRWHHYRDKVRLEIIERKRKFYAEKVQHLRKSDTRSWWKLVKRISGQSNNIAPIHIEKNGVILTDVQLANALNEFYISVNADIPPLDMHEIPAFLPAAEQVPVIYSYQVCEKLQKLKSQKAMGPDNIPPRLLKEFAYELAEPITDLFNLSLSSGIFPDTWRCANVIPIPKEVLPKEEGDLRPICLTPCISKVLEEFVAEWILEDIAPKIDHKQFGVIKGTSTTLCLLDMFHNWLLNLDMPGQYLRICFLDFSKAFDRINLNILVTKLVFLGVRRSLLPWICSFLSNRKQRVKLGKSLSEWIAVNAGVPQGTKLGPILFLVMINDLALPTCDYWKYVDDLTVSEVISKYGNSSIQSDLDYISSWSSANYMKLNVKKCKELRVCFFRDTPVLEPLTINEIPIDVVDCHKILGTVINSSLKWTDHVNMITKKAAKRLYIIRTLKRSGMTADDLLTIYIALIRSVLEYCCPVWHTNLPLYLSEQVERLQRRVLRIIYPSLSYGEALSVANCVRLDDNRQRLCLNLFQKINSDCDNKLNLLIPNSRFSEHGRSLRNCNSLSILNCNTDRFKRSFFPALTQYFNNIFN